MPVITLTTGWIDDYYVAVLKGILLSALPSVQIIDLSHRTPPFNSGITHAAYMIKHCYTYYPKGTVHLISVASECSDATPFVAAPYDGQYFIGTDNGIFSLIFDSVPSKMVRIEKYTDAASPNYPALSVFAPAAIHLLTGGDIDELGSAYPECRRKGMALAVIEASSIVGGIVHINAFGNAVTNITREDFDRVGQGRPFEITLPSTRNKITRINRYYRESSAGELVALFDLSGLLEISQNKGNIALMLQLQLHTPVMIKFFDR
jgi:S-adenosylmethionine hydrolase